MHEFLPDANYRFEKFGTVSLKYEDEHVEITTLREEGEYIDSHTHLYKVCNRPAKDYIRRDFTINALYIDENYRVLIFVMA